MKQDTTKPLWQRLNEERTPKEWVLQGMGSDKYLRQDNNGGVLCEFTDYTSVTFLSKQEFEANAQYTALAVNNLHHLAEALEELIEVFKGAWATEKDKETYNKAKEALSRIS